MTVIGDIAISIEREPKTRRPVFRCALGNINISTLTTTEEIRAACVALIQEVHQFEFETEKGVSDGR